MKDRTKKIITNRIKKAALIVSFEISEQATEQLAIYLFKTYLMHEIDEETILWHLKQENFRP